MKILISVCVLLMTGWLHAESVTEECLWILANAPGPRLFGKQALSEALSRAYAELKADHAPGLRIQWLRVHYRGGMGFTFATQYFAEHVLGSATRKLTIPGSNLAKDCSPDELCGSFAPLETVTYGPNDPRSWRPGSLENFVKRAKGEVRLVAIEDPRMVAPDVQRDLSRALARNRFAPRSPRGVEGKIIFMQGIQNVNDEAAFRGEFLDGIAQDVDIRVPITRRALTLAGVDYRFSPELTQALMGLETTFQTRIHPAIIREEIVRHLQSQPESWHGGLRPGDSVEIGLARSSINTLIVARIPSTELTRSLFFLSFASSFLNDYQGPLSATKTKALRKYVEQMK